MEVNKLRKYPILCFGNALKQTTKFFRKTLLEMSKNELLKDYKFKNKLKICT